MRTTSGQIDAHGYAVLRRVRRFGSLLLLLGAVVVVPLTQPLLDPTRWLETVPAAMAIALLAICLLLRSVTAYVHSSHRREIEIAEAARRDGAILAANTMRHHVGNKLAVAVGYSEMLADDPRLPPDVQEHAAKVVTSAMAAADVVQRFDRPLLRLELDTSVAGPQLLDLEASSEAS